MPNPAPESLPPVPGTPIAEEKGPNIETLPIEDRDFNDFIIVDPMGAVPAIYVYFKKEKVPAVEFEIDYYENFKWRSRQGLYEVDPLKKLYPDESREIIEKMVDKVAAVVIPKAVHKKCSKTYGGRNNQNVEMENGEVLSQKDLDASSLEGAVNAKWDANA